MAINDTKILVLGASGYVGGSIAVHLSWQGYLVRGLIRSATNELALREKGIAPVTGDLNHPDTFKDSLDWADVVINTASSDHKGVVDFILSYWHGSGKTYIHTSGSSIVTDDAWGEQTDSRHSETQMTVHPERSSRNDLDHRILDAGNDHLRTFVFCPPMIYGTGLGIKPDSNQIPTLVKLAKQRGRVPVVGNGNNIWSNVHIVDLVILYQLAIESKVPGGFYFVENGQESLRSIASNLQKQLFSKGSPEFLSVEEASEVFGYNAARFLFGSNSIVTANKARHTFGWKPRMNGVSQSHSWG